jgi:hypothetical protein
MYGFRAAVRVQPRATRAGTREPGPTTATPVPLPLPTDAAHLCALAWAPRLARSSGLGRRRAVRALVGARSGVCHSELRNAAGGGLRMAPDPRGRHCPESDRRR